MKVLASDFDNTLYFKNLEKGFKDSDIQAIRSFQAQGHLFGMCSGRPLAGLLAPLQNIIQPDFFIVSSGGAILDKDCHLLYGKTLSYAIAKEIYETYQDETVLLCQTLSQDEVYITADDNQGTSVLISSIEDMQGKELYSISLIKSTVERARQITQEINERYHEVVAFQNIDSIDVLAAGCSKGQAILKLKQLLGIEKVCGIGDSYNDLPMIEVADTSFTFKTSPQDIQKQTDYTVSSIQEAIAIIKEE